MVNALIKIKKETNKVLNIVKATHGLRDKSEAVEFVVKKFVENSDDELSPLFKAQKEKMRELWDNEEDEHWNKV